DRVGEAVDQGPLATQGQLRLLARGDVAKQAAEAGRGLVAAVPVVGQRELDEARRLLRRLNHGLPALHALARPDEPGVEIGAPAGRQKERQWLADQELAPAL